MIPPDVIKAKQMSIVIKATEDVDFGKSSSAYINIPVAGDDHIPTMEEQYSSQITEDQGQGTGDFSLSPPIELVVTDEDPFPVDQDFNFLLKGEQSSAVTFRYLFLSTKFIYR